MLTLSAIFSDHGVLQRQMPVPVWGWTAPCTTVTINIDSITVSAVSNDTGRFIITLPAHEAGGPYTMKVATANEEVIVDDLYYGEVWIAGGQSNMEMPLTGFNLPIMPQAELDKLEFPENFRLIQIRKSALIFRREQVRDYWRLGNDHNNFPFMTAFGSFFAAKLGQELGNIPVGIISCNWGGTVAEAWMSREALEEIPALSDGLAAYEARISDPDYCAFKVDYTAPNLQEAAEEINLLDLERFIQSNPLFDITKQDSEGREMPDFDDSSWVEGELPVKNWKTSHGFELGAVWFRKEVQIPEAWAGKTLKLGIGAVDKHDVTYFNGVEVGRCGERFQTNFWCMPRFYDVPASAVKAGRAIIAVRAYSFLYDGGMIGPVNTMAITCPELPDSGSISLAGTWKGYQSISFAEIPIACLTAPGPGSDQAISTSNCDALNTGHLNPNSYHILFDSMLWQLIPYAVRGAIWYQGCSNENQPQHYTDLMTTLINDWRRKWHQPEFAFIQTLLAGYQLTQAKENWPLIRQAQVNSAEATGTSFVNIMDLGDAEDIHPLRKQEAGQRMALVALADVYGKDIIAHGPQNIGMVRNGQDISLLFDYADGLNCRGDQPDGFEFVDQDGKVTAAKAEICGNKIVFRQVPENMASIRYAWNSYPENANCYNKYGLPMTPFCIEID